MVYGAIIRVLEQLFHTFQTSEYMHMSSDLSVSRLNSDLIALFCNMVANGYRIRTVCRALRLEESTVEGWMRKGKSEQIGIHREFYERVLQADSAAETFFFEKWKSHIDRDPRVAERILSRRWPEHWAETKYVRLAVEREMESMMRELQRRLPEEIFLLVANELASISQEQIVSVASE